MNYNSNNEQPNKRASFYNPYSSFLGNFNKDVGGIVLSNVLENSKTRDEANCLTRNLLTNKANLNYVKNTLDSMNLPSLKEYQQSHLYYRNKLDDQYNIIYAPYVIGCNKVCMTSENCAVNLNEEDTIHFPGVSFSSSLKIYKEHIIDNILRDETPYPFERVYGLRKIIWKCECLPFELPLTLNGMKEQKLFYKKGGNWTLIEIIERLIQFYQENISPIEAEQLSTLIPKEFDLLSFEDKRIYLPRNVIKEEDIIKEDYEEGREEYLQLRFTIDKDYIEEFLSIENLITLPRYLLIVDDNEETEPFFSNIDLKTIVSPEGEEYKILSLGVTI